jgi:hypothetical protein
MHFETMPYTSVEGCLTKFKKFDRYIKAWSTPSWKNENSLKEIDAQARIAMVKIDSVKRIYDFYGQANVDPKLNEKLNELHKITRTLRDWRRKFPESTEPEEPKLDLSCFQLPSPRYRLIVGKAYGRPDGDVHPSGTISVFRDVKDDMTLQFVYLKSIFARHGAMLDHLWIQLTASETHCIPTRSKGSSQSRCRTAGMRMRRRRRTTRTSSRTASMASGLGSTAIQTIGQVTLVPLRFKSEARRLHSGTEKRTTSGKRCQSPMFIFLVSRAGRERPLTRCSRSTSSLSQRPGIRLFGRRRTGVGARNVDEGRKRKNCQLGNRRYGLGGGPVDVAIAEEATLPTK